MTIFMCLCCSPRVSYLVRVLHEDPKFTGRTLSKADIAVLPLLGAAGPVTVEELTPDSIMLSRPDLALVPPYAFEEEFRERFDMNVLPDFYAGIFREDILAVKAMSDIWRNIGQPYLLVFSLTDGASVRNADASTFRHVTVKCEIWSREKREVVWRASCKGVSDDGSASDTRLITESMRRLAGSIPGAPDYGKKRS